MSQSDTSVEGSTTPAGGLAASKAAVEAQIIDIKSKKPKEEESAGKRPLFALEDSGRIQVNREWRGALHQLEGLLNDPASLSALTGTPCTTGLHYNQLRLEIELDRKPLPWKFDDLVLQLESAAGARLYRVKFERDPDGETVPKMVPVDLRADAIRKALLQARRTRAYDPVKDYLNALPAWDGVQRLETALDSIFQAPGFQRDPQDVVRTFLPNWMTGAVARAMNPGAKVDSALILLGETQGQYKSEFFARIVPDRGWYTASKVQIPATRDTLLTLHRKFIVELSELAAIKRAEVEDIKNFIPLQVDNFRAPYGTADDDYPRRFVFGGTTNKPDMLRDNQNRRFWVYECAPDRAGDMKWLDDNRDQLWAEALHRYNAGTTWWPDFELQKRINAYTDGYRQAADVQEADILQAIHYVEADKSPARPFFKTAEVIAALHNNNVAGFDPDLKDHARLTQRIDNVLVAHGYSRTRANPVRINGKVGRGWYKRQT